MEVNGSLHSTDADTRDDLGIWVGIQEETRMRGLLENPQRGRLLTYVLPSESKDGLNTRQLEYFEYLHDGTTTDHTQQFKIGK